MKLARMPDGEPEIFHTLQGEGRGIGLPSVFIRSSLCNLHCRWCDTDYTWNWVGTPFAHDRDAEPGYAKYRREEQIVDLPVGAVADRAAGYGCPNFVFTGGEPLLHESDWVALMVNLRGRFVESCHFEVETNGTQLPGAEFLAAIDQINVSPKLGNSGVEEKLRLRPTVLRSLLETGKADLKFVVATEADLAEVDRLATELGVDPERVFLMPRAASVADLDRAGGWVADACLQRGFRYSDRLHLRLFGAKRGV